MVQGHKGRGKFIYYSFFKLFIIRHNCCMENVCTLCTEISFLLLVLNYINSLSNLMKQGPRYLGMTNDSEIVKMSSGLS